MGHPVQRSNKSCSSGLVKFGPADATDLPGLAWVLLNCVLQTIGSLYMGPVCVGGLAHGRKGESSFFTFGLPVWAQFKKIVTFISMSFDNITCLGDLNTSILYAFHEILRCDF